MRGTNTTTSRRPRPRRVTAVAALLALATALVGLPPSAPEPADAATDTPPAGFEISTVLGGDGSLILPTAARFAPDGRVFVAEKRGIVKVFDGLDDPTPAIFADLRTEVASFADRGLLGLELDPQFPSRPYLYVLYSRDASIGGTAPRWSPSPTSDACPDPPGLNADGCLGSARLARLTVRNAAWDGAIKVLVDDWCVQYATHSIGTVEIGPDGALYASAGDGASAAFLDYGQGGGSAGSPTPANPCGDPPRGIGRRLSAPSAQGGALRAQDVFAAGDPLTLDGSIIRVNPDTGAGYSTNPFATSADANKRRIIAYGLRNPFRFAFRPGTNELWAGDVGWDLTEEVNRITNVRDRQPRNFGWPCFEGNRRRQNFLQLDVCRNLSLTKVTFPTITYEHAGQVVKGEACPAGSASVSTIAFTPTGNQYPAAYAGGLFLGDYSRGCMWFVPKGASGLPDWSKRRTFASGVYPVDLQAGPGGDLFMTDIATGSILRIRYLAGNRPPKAQIAADRTAGPAPLTVDLRASAVDPDGDPMTYEWDLDGDGAFDDGSAPSATATYADRGVIDVRVRVRDPLGAEGVATQRILVDEAPPVVDITSPEWSASATGGVATSTWSVGTTIAFSGSARDLQDGAIPESRLEWQVILKHCDRLRPTVCHSHYLASFPGVAAGSVVAPDHEYPSSLELRLLATDSAGLVTQQAVRLEPRTVDLTVASSPAGARVAIGSVEGTAPLTARVITGSRNTLTTPSPQTIGGRSYAFQSWSDGGAAVHDVVATTTRTVTARFAPR